MTETEAEELEQDETDELAYWIALILLSMGDSLEEAEYFIKRFFWEYGVDDTVDFLEARRYMSAKDHRRRIDVLLDDVKKSMDKAFNQITDYFENLINTAITLESTFWDVEVEGISLKWGEDNKDWLQRLKADEIRLKNYVLLDIKHSIAAGHTLSETLTQLAKRNTQSENVLKRLARTEYTAAASLARKEIYKKDEYSEYIYHAFRGCCGSCAELNGKHFPVDAYLPGVNAPPMHANCRCMTLEAE